MPLTLKHSRDELQHALTNALELKSESLFQKTLTHNLY